MMSASIRRVTVARRVRFSSRLAESIAVLPGGMIFTCTPRRLLAEVSAAGRLIWERK
jgi:hypothetical protein